jgi:hypothetical protein
MSYEKSISEAKQEFTNIVREVGMGYEVIVSNHKSPKRGRVSIISTDVYEDILEQGFKFRPIIEKDEENKGFTISLNELLIHGDGPTIYEALLDLASNIMDYAGDYIKRFNFFRQIDNRKSHYPYLRRISKCPDINEVMEVIAECHTDLQQAILRK